MLYPSGIVDCSSSNLHDQLFWLPFYHILRSQRFQKSLNQWQLILAKQNIVLASFHGARAPKLQASERRRIARPFKGLQRQTKDTRGLDSRISNPQA